MGFWTIGSYRRLPYELRYLVAVVAWVLVVAADVLLRIMFLPAMPFFWLATGFGRTQVGAQMNVNLVEFYTRPLMRRPLRRRRASENPAKPRTVQVIGNSRI